MKILLFLTALQLSLFANGQKAKNKLIYAFDNGFSMSVPADADTMSAEKMKKKYNKIPDGKTLFYADKNAEFSIVITPMADGITEKEMLEHKKQLTDQFIGKGYVLEENTVRKVNGHDLIVVAFYSAAPDGKIFNRRFFAVVNGKLILVTFNTAATDMDTRKEQIEESISSVTIK